MINSIFNHGVFSVYIHYPFCRRICPYCDFNVVKFNSGKEDPYLLALLHEIENTLSNHYGKLLTIYFGGGTPSLIKSDYLVKIINLIRKYHRIDEALEITLEVNPEDLKSDNVKAWYDAGINRVSLGVQATNEKHLSFLKRAHSWYDVEKGVELLKKIGFSNISVDTIFGLPDQTISELIESLNKITNLEIPHISAYELTIELGTPFFRNQTLKKWKDSSHDLLADMSIALSEHLSKSGFIKYEVSNYSHINFQSVHNNSYWKLNDYLGFGAGAHSFVRNKSELGGKRWSNLHNLLEYQKNSPNSKAWIEDLSSETLAFEQIMVGLRTTAGVNRSEFKKYYNFDVLDLFESAILKYSDYGMLKINPDVLATTQKGLLLLNSILSDPLWQPNP